MPALLGVAACLGEDPETIAGGPAPGDDGGASLSDGAAAADDASSVTDGGGDGGDGGVAGPCNLAKPFGAPKKLTSLGGPSDTQTPRLSWDGQELYVSREVTVKGAPAAGIVRYVAADGGWDSPSALAVNDIGDGGLMHSSALSLTADDKSAFFERTDRFNLNRGISKLTRTAPAGTWSSPLGVTVTDPAGQPAAPTGPWINADGSRLYFAQANGTVYQAAFNGTGYGPAKALGFGANDMNPVLSRDEKRIYFASSRPHPAPHSGVLVYTSTRASVEGDFAPPEFVAELNEGFNDLRPSWVSVDGCTLVLSGRTAMPGVDVYVASKPK
ncbi:MAG: hypothetical protein KF795_16330 [Labilithrix sp.]|nr:hypothetical protein [Labilithrix sp.]